MATEKQKLGAFGESVVVKGYPCPTCKRKETLQRLPRNFKCVDIICDFCGFVAQVKAKQMKSIEKLPKNILGAAWKPQLERMDAGIYFPLYIVLVVSTREYAIYYISADLQVPEMFIPRKPLSTTAKRAGWQGFIYDLSKIQARGIVRLK